MGVKVFGTLVGCKVVGTQMKAWPRWWIVGGIVCVIALTAAACGGGGEESTAPTPAETPSPVVLPTVNPNVSLVAYQSPDKGYSIDYPEGWQYEVGSGQATDFFVWSTPEGRDLAQLSVMCVEGENLTADSLLMKDAANVIPYGGVIDSRQAHPIQVDGVEGKQIRYFVALGDLTIEHIVAYVVKGPCGWRIGLNSYGAGSLDPYVPLFSRIIPTFHVS